MVSMILLIKIKRRIDYKYLDGSWNPKLKRGLVHLCEVIHDFSSYSIIKPDSKNVYLGTAKIISVDVVASKDLRYLVGSEDNIGYIFGPYKVVWYEEKPPENVSNNQDGVSQEEKESRKEDKGFISKLGNWIFSGPKTIADKVSSGITAITDGITSLIKGEGSENKENQEQQEQNKETNSEEIKQEEEEQPEENQGQETNTEEQKPQQKEEKKGRKGRFRSSIHWLVR
jgi:hypothetical protein